MPLTVVVEGLDKLIRDVDEAGGNARKLVKAALVNSVNHIQSRSRAAAPHRTGTLQRSILTQVDYPSAQVSVGEKYGVYIERGTGLYGDEKRLITPKKAKALAWSKGGSMVFARSSKGMKPRPFFKPSVEASAEYVTAQFAKVIELLVDGLAGKGH